MGVLAGLAAAECAIKKRFSRSHPSCHRGWPGSRGDNLEVAMRYAVSQGGDAVTVAAITGGIPGCRNETQLAAVGDRGILAGTAELHPLVDGREELRRTAYG
jgi:hypothetical protein